jgi:HPt (histidine-containing phosphotransfer) domain-containing protein
MSDPAQFEKSSETLDDLTNKKVSSSDPAYQDDDFTSGICRPQEAISRLAGYTDLYSDTLAMFFAEAPQTLDRLKTQIESAQWREVQRSAHAFKGIAGMCGAESVARAAAIIERTALSGRHDTLSAWFVRLDGEMTAAALELAAYRKTS